MKLISIFGTRPQLIKVSMISKSIGNMFEHISVDTGQHYDDNMSKIFFEELEIPKPKYNLGIGSGTHGYQTGEMLKRIEDVLKKENPKVVLVYGDTNSTLAGALASAKLHIPVAHIEAGLRSFNKSMPEEINRIVTDHISDILFTPTQTAVNNLKQEGITKGVFNVGDVMYDSLLYFLDISNKKSKIMEKYGLKPRGYYFATIHRAENTDNKNKLTNIVNCLININEPLVFPIHPRTLKKLKDYHIYSKLKTAPNILLTDALGYLDSIQLMKNAKKIITDSGGIQKEAYMLDVPCITLREETEWIETVQSGWNILTGTDAEKIINAIDHFNPYTKKLNLFGDGKASLKVHEILCELFSTDLEAA